MAKDVIYVIEEKFGKELKQTCNARDLWQWLQSKQDFSTWIKNRIDKYGFEENIDYIKLHKKMELSKTGQNIIEYYLTVDMAKELSMIENNEKGRQTRKYFINVELLKTSAAESLSTLQIEVNSLEGFDEISPACNEVSRFVNEKSKKTNQGENMKISYELLKKHKAWKDWLRDFEDYFGKETEVDIWEVIKLLKETKNSHCYISWLFINFKLTGVARNWWSDDQLSSESTYKNGERHGRCREWYIGGQLYCEENYINGKKHGRCREWCSNGRLWDEVYYRHGVPI